MKYIMIMTTLILIISNALNADIASVTEKLKVLEASSEGRLGVFALNTANHAIIDYRANERFPTGCTSQLMGISAVLKKSMSDPSLLLTTIHYSEEDIKGWSPITKQHVTSGMTIQELCAASIGFSDNTSMNLLLKVIDGVQGMNTFAHSIGDLSFRQDHDWPAESFSGGAHNLEDSSTPKSMVESLQKLTLGEILDPPQKDLLITWLIQTQTGANRIKSVLPNGWVMGHKTGTGSVYGSTNDLAIIWPPNHAPLFIGIYYTTDKEEAPKREDIVADAARIIIEAFSEKH